MHNSPIISTRKSLWLILLMSTLALQAIALYFQYVLELLPCVKCINQRAALYGVLLSALLGLCFSHRTIIRFISTLGWAVFSLLGSYQSYLHVDAQLNPHPLFSSCDIAPFFPHWMPLDQWLPVLFKANGDCGNIDWQFLSLSMPQWMLGLFSVYFAIATLVIFYEVTQYLKARLQ